MKDIENKQDIELLVESFYKKATSDPIIGHFFTKVIPISWDIHIPLIVSFWESVLFGTNSYKGNPMIAHMELNKLSSLEAVHFKTWLKIWTETISENFAGPKSNEAASRAETIAQLMQHKITESK